MKDCFIYSKWYSIALTTFKWSIAKKKSCVHGSHAQKEFFFCKLFEFSIQSCVITFTLMDWQFSNGCMSKLFISSCGEYKLPHQQSKLQPSCNLCMHACDILLLCHPANDALCFKDFEAVHVMCNTQSPQDLFDPPCHNNMYYMSMFMSNLMS